MYIHVNDSRKKYINENKDTIYQNIRDATRAALRGEAIALNVDSSEVEKSQVNNQSLELKN